MTKAEDDLNTLSAFLRASNLNIYAEMLADPEEAAKFLRAVGINPDGGMRANRITHNSGLYNAYGDKIGWSDLSAEDFDRIRAKLPDGVPLFALSEMDSFWNFVVNVPDHGKSRTVGEEHPGTTYVVEHANYMILDRVCYIIDRVPYDNSKFYTIDGCSFIPLKRDDILTKIRTYLH